MQCHIKRILDFWSSFTGPCLSATAAPLSAKTWLSQSTRCSKTNYIVHSSMRGQSGLFGLYQQGKDPLPNHFAFLATSASTSFQCNYQLRCTENYQISWDALKTKCLWAVHWRPPSLFRLQRACWGLSLSCLLPLYRSHYEFSSLLHNFITFIVNCVLHFIILSYSSSTSA